jgi:hypothetical protein
MDSGGFVARANRQMLDDMRQEIQSAPQAFAELVDNTRDMCPQGSVSKILDLHIEVNPTPDSR